MAGFPAPDMVFTPGKCLVPEELSVTEDLFYSRSVTYGIANICDQPVTHLISFKGKRFDHGGLDQDNRRKDLSTLKVAVNGQAVALAHEAKAWIGDKDVTEAVEKAGLSPNIIAVAADEYESETGLRWVIAREHNLSAKKLPGLVDEDDCPVWEVENIYSFTQAFPPGETTVIHYTHDNLYEYFQTGPTPADSVNPEDMALNGLFLRGYGIHVYNPEIQYASRTSFTAASTPWEHPIKNVTIVMNEFKEKNKGDEVAAENQDYRVRPSDLGAFQQLLEIKAGNDSRVSTSSVTLKINEYKPDGGAIEFLYITRKLADKE